MRLCNGERFSHNLTKGDSKGLREKRSGTQVKPRNSAFKGEGLSEPLFMTKSLKGLMTKEARSAEVKLEK